MEVSEVFEKIANHMIKGMMTHEALANYYDFLGLQGYKRCHEYHFLDETIAYRSVCRYYINHNNKLIPDSKQNGVEIIPESWYSHSRFDVDTSTKRSAVKNAFEVWHKWETETKELYEQMYNCLISIDEVADACKVKQLIKDVDEELKMVEREVLDLKAVDYDINYIIEKQHCLHEKYKKKMKKELKITIC
jgi:hypothetical protein